MTAEFQSTRPHGARRAQLAIFSSVRRFNPRARTGRDLMMGLTVAHSSFQSTRPHGARLTRSVTVVRWRWFQSTRPHGARHPAESPQTRPAPVSIHAPARGATRGTVHTSFDIVFQSTRPHGARRRAGERAARGVCFNPRARTGRDAGRRVSACRCPVSIHAPARGATIFSCSAGDRLLFQSTRPHGARRALPALPRSLPSVSIHAPARGATRRSR